MKLNTLYETLGSDYPRETVIRALYKYLVDNGIPRSKIDDGLSAVLYIGGSPGSSPRRNYIRIIDPEDHIIHVAYHGDRPHYLALEVDIHDPDSFPKVLEFVKARKDVVGESLYEDHPLLINLIAQYLLDNGIRSEKLGSFGSAQLVVPPVSRASLKSPGLPSRQQIRIWAFDNGLIDAIHYTNPNIASPFRVHLNVHDPGSLEKLKDFIMKFEDVWTAAIA